MRALKWAKENTFFIILLLIAILLRFIPLNQYQFSHDELSALSRTIFPGLKQEILYGVQYTDTHPLLIQVCLYYWVKVVGYSEIAVKIPFLICGILSVWAIYRFSKKWFGLQAALYTQLILSTSFIFILYSTYARMYAPGMLFSILSLHYLFSILFESKPSKKAFVLFGLFCLLSALNNHLNALFALTCAISGLFFIGKKNLVPYLITGMAVILCYLPHLPITLTQFQTGGLGVHDHGWLPAPRYDVLIYFIKTLFGTGTAGLLIAFLSIAVMTVSLILKHKISNKQGLLLLLFLINYGIIHVYSIFKSPVLQYSVLLFSAPCLVVFFASFYSYLSKKVFYGMATILLGLLLFQSIFVKHVLNDAHRQDFEMMIREAFYKMNDHGDRTVSAVFSAEQYFISLYELKYHQKINYQLITDSVFSNIKNTKAYFASLPPGIDHLVLGDVSPLVVELTKERFPVISDHQQGYFYNVMSLSGLSYKDKAIKDDAVIKEYHLFQQPGFFKLETPLSPKDHSYFLDSLGGEFPFTCKAKFSDLHAREGQWLLVEMAFETGSLQLTKEDLLCISINTADSAKNYFTSARFADFQTTQHTNKVYLQVFIGSDIDEWNQSGEFACFIWKKDKSVLKLKSFDLRQISYNPDKWKLWE